MPRYVTDFGTVVETDKPQTGWRPTKEPLTAASAPESSGESDIGGALETGLRHTVETGASVLTAPFRAVGAGLELAGITKQNPFTARGMFGDINANPHEAAREQAQDVAHPIAAGVGDVAGTLAGSGPLGALGGAVGGGVTRALGGGLAGRLAGAGAAGAAEGGTFGLADAAAQADRQQQALDGQHALASAGLGALLGGGLRFGGAAAGELFDAAKGVVQPAVDKFADEAPWKVGKAIADAGEGIGGHAVKVGLKAAGLSHGIPGYLVGDLIGESVAPAIGRAIERNSGALGAIAQRGARAASQAIDAVTSAGQAASTLAPAALPSAMSVFLGRHDNPEDAYEARVSELQGLAGQNGQGIRNAIVESLGPLADQQPAAVMAMTHSATAGIDYLLSKLPGQPIDTNSLTPLADRFVPPRADISGFMRIYAAVMKPATVLADIRRGTVTTDQLDAVRAIYPDWYQDNVVAQYGDRLRKLDASGQRLGYGQQRVANLALGTSAGLDSLDLALQIGPAFTQQAKADAAPRHVGSGPNSKPQTATDAILGAGRT